MGTWLITIIKVGQAHSDYYISLFDMYTGLTALYSRDYQQLAPDSPVRGCEFGVKLL